MRILPLLMVLVSALMSCSDDPAEACAAGTSQSCACPSGGEGVQVCREDSSGFESCVCGGSGGSGGGMAADCVPGETTVCYDGPTATEGIGECRSGTRTCLATEVWGECEGQVLPATDLCSTLEDEDCDDERPSCPWQVAMYGSDAGSPLDLALAPDDGVVVVGFFQGDHTFGDLALSAPISGDGFVAKVSLEGEALWTRQLTGLDAAYIQAVTVRPDGVIVVVGTFADEADFGLGSTIVATGPGAGFVWALDSDGEPLWVEVLESLAPNGTDQLIDVVADGDGNVFVTGSAAALQFEFGGAQVQSQGYFFAKLSPTGSLVWSASPPVGSMARLAVDAQGRLVVLAGSQGGPFDLGDGPIEAAAVVLRYNDDGTLDGYFPYPFPFDGTAGGLRSVSTLPNGGVRIVQPSEGNAIDFGDEFIGPHGSFVLDIDSELAFAKGYGIGEGGGQPRLGHHALAPDGSMLLVGALSGTDVPVLGMSYSSMYDAGFYVRTDSLGTPTTATFINPGENNAMTISRVVFTSSGMPIVMGYYSSEVDLGLGLGPLPTLGSGGRFVARLE